MFAIVGVVHAEDGEGFFGNFMQKREAKVEEVKEKSENRLRERDERFASTTARIEDRLEKREARATTSPRFASTTIRIEDRLRDREDRFASTTAKIRAKIDERLNRIASTTQVWKQKMTDKFTSGVENRISKVVDNLTDALTKLTSADVKLLQRIKTLQENNIDTTVAEGLIKTAETKLDSAKTQVSLLKSSVEGVLAGGVSTSTKATIKTKLEDARNAVKDAHKAFVNVQENLKPGFNKVRTATSTATSTNQ